MKSDGSFSLGHNAWSGLGKCIEESGELNQVLGKLIANHGDTNYYADLDLREKLIEELADDMAAKQAFIMLNMSGIEINKITDRMNEKYLRFIKWHEEGIG